jgi:cobalamin biosynthesis protein CobT
MLCCSIGLVRRSDRLEGANVIIKVKKKISDNKFAIVKSLHSRNGNSPYKNEAAAKREVLLHRMSFEGYEERGRRWFESEAMTAMRIQDERVIELLVSPRNVTLGAAKNSTENMVDDDGEEDDGEEEEEEEGEEEYDDDDENEEDEIDEEVGTGGGGGGGVAATEDSEQFRRYVRVSHLPGQAVPRGRPPIHSKPPSKLELDAEAKAAAAADEEMFANYENGK